MKQIACCRAVVLFLVVWAGVPPAFSQDDLQNGEYLFRAVRNLAAQNRAEGIYAFLENEFPEFSKVLKSAGLAEVLDGRVPIAEFETRWSASRTAYEQGGGSLPSVALDELYSGFRRAMEARPSGPPPADDNVAGMAERMPVDALQRQLYTTDHPLAGWSEMKTVEMTSVPGRLLWFNPDLAIPELGIRPGTPLTPQQEAGLVRLFAVRVTGQGGTERVGTASYPADVGRAVTLATRVLTVVDGNSGEILGELNLKGIGVNPSTATQRIWNCDSPVGVLEGDEALTDAEAARSLRRAQVKAYAPVAIVEVPDGTDGKISGGRVVYVRASETLVRLSPHLESTQTADLKLLLEYVAREAGLNEVGKPLSVRTWAEEYLPKRLGRNAGITAEIGFQHTDHSGNIAPGEMVDFGEAELFHRYNTEGTVSSYRGGRLAAILDAVEKVLPAGERLDRESILRKFDDAVDRGRKWARRWRVALRVSDRFIPKIMETQLSHILGGYTYWIEQLGGVETAENLAALRGELRKWGIQPPAGQELTARWMSEEIRRKYETIRKSASRGGDGNAAGLQQILRMVGGEDAKAVDQLRRKPLEELRQLARDRGFARAETYNTEQLVRLLMYGPEMLPVKRHETGVVTRGAQTMIDRHFRQVRERWRFRMRARPLEVDLARRLGRESDLHVGVTVVRVDGKMIVAGLNGRLHPDLQRGKLLGKALLLRMKPGTALELGSEIRAADVEQAWVLVKNGKEWKGRLAEDFRTAFGSDPLPLRRPAGRTPGRVGVEIDHASRFAGAYLLNEAAHGVGRFEEALDHVRTTEFWTSLGIFTVASRAVDAGLRRPVVAQAIPARLRTLTRSGVPLAVGMAAADLASGRPLDGRRLAVSTGSFLTAGAFSDLVTHSVLPMVLKRTPTGWAFETVKLGLTLFVAESMERGIYGATGWSEGPSRRHER